MLCCAVMGWRVAGGGLELECWMGYKLCVALSNLPTNTEHQPGEHQQNAGVQNVWLYVICDHCCDCSDHWPGRQVDPVPGTDTAS